MRDRREKMKAGLGLLCTALVFLACRKEEKPTEKPAQPEPADGRAEVEVAPDPVQRAVTTVLQGVIDDIGAIKEKYPELAEWNLKAAHGNGFEYSFRYTPSDGRRYKVAPVTEEHGCYLGMRAWLNDKPSARQLRPRYQLPNLRLGVHTWVLVGKKSSHHFRAEIAAIFRKHVRVLLDLEARVAAEKHQPVLTRVLQGMIDDIGAIKDKYPELAEWDVKTPSDNRFSYSHQYRVLVPGTKSKPSKLQLGEHACTMDVWVRFTAAPWQRQLRPTRWFPSLGVAIYTRVRVGQTPSEGFVAEVEGIFAKHIRKLKELDAQEAHRTGYDRIANVSYDGTSRTAFRCVASTAKQAFRVGEPVLVNVSLVNNLPHSVRLRDVPWHYPFFSFEVVGPKGRAVPLTKEFPRSDKRPKDMWKTLPSGEEYVVQITLSEWYDLSQPGTYTVNARWRLYVKQAPYERYAEPIAVEITGDVP